MKTDMEQLVVAVVCACVCQLLIHPKLDRCSIWTINATQSQTVCAPVWCSEYPNVPPLSLYPDINQQGELVPSLISHPLASAYGFQIIQPVEVLFHPNVVDRVPDPPHMSPVGKLVPKPL